MFCLRRAQCSSGCRKRSGAEPTDLYRYRSMAEPLPLPVLRVSDHVTHPLCQQSRLLKLVAVLLYVHRNRSFTRDGSPARPPSVSAIHPLYQRPTLCISDHVTHTGVSSRLLAVTTFLLGLVCARFIQTSIRKATSTHTHTTLHYTTLHYTTLHTHIQSYLQLFQMSSINYPRDVSTKHDCCTKF